MNGAFAAPVGNPPAYVPPHGVVADGDAYLDRFLGSLSWKWPKDASGTAHGQPSMLTWLQSISTDPNDVLSRSPATDNSSSLGALPIDTHDPLQPQKQLVILELRQVTDGQVDYANWKSEAVRVFEVYQAILDATARLVERKMLPNWLAPKWPNLSVI